MAPNRQGNAPICRGVSCQCRNVTRRLPRIAPESLQNGL